MRVTIRHLTSYRYDPGAATAAMRLKLFPPTTAAQTPQDWRVTVNGEALEPILTEAQGDGVGLWHAHVPVDHVEIVAGGTVETRDTAGVLGDFIEAARPAIFLRRTRLTEPSDAVRDLAAGTGGGDPLARLHAISAAVGEAIDYRPGVSEVTTTAAEAMTLGAGVCQDQTHVFISAARELGMPARYVVGYLHDPDRAEPATETHAWAEAHVAELGWVAFDITNRICPTDLYVRLCTGLDAADAAPVRGTVRGATEESLVVEVAVTPAGQWQSQQQQQCP